MILTVSEKMSGQTYYKYLRETIAIRSRTRQEVLIRIKVGSDGVGFVCSFF